MLSLVFRRVNFVGALTKLYCAHLHAGSLRSAIKATSYVLDRKILLLVSMILCRLVGPFLLTLGRLTFAFAIDSILVVVYPGLAADSAVTQWFQPLSFYTPLAVVTFVLLS